MPKEISESEQKAPTEPQTDTRKENDSPVGSNLPVKRKRGHNLKGRPKGTKNKTTLFKEVMREGFEKKLERDFAKVLDVTVEMAKKGDIKAIKLLMDRVVPVSKAVDMEQMDKKKGMTINISVGSMEQVSLNEEAMEAEYEEMDTPYPEDEDK